jgi:lipopolysaccharide/colanic/teichoic acid biosynthesis glycosyltransferase
MVTADVRGSGPASWSRMGIAVTVTVRRYRGGDGVRRAVDVALAAVVATVASPLVLLVGIAVRWRLGPPVLFRQQRSGLLGAEFSICKFRTMRDERYPGEPDPARLSPLGKVLRSTSLDELPQLWNVARGEMALIGPRPTLPEQVVHYTERQRGRLAVRPGITGWAQVKTRNSVGWPERIELDVWYVEHRSWSLDARILLLTALQLLRPTGVTAAGGVNPGFPVPRPLTDQVPA